VQIPLQRAGTAYVALVLKKEERQVEGYVAIDLKDREPA
jgi:hypothetical protein